jgi:rfaE bifunctional protein kinase chain/domain
MATTHKGNIVFISGNFNVLHAGHIRLFAFARNFGALLVVGVISDKYAGAATYVEESDRFEAVKTNKRVHEAILIDEPLETVLRRLQPTVVIKGREFEHQINVEEKILQEWGGRLIFGSSEVSLSSLELMKRELGPQSEPGIHLPETFCKRYSISADGLSSFLKDFQGLKVCVIGDLIVDEYISCESLGMSREDPSLVVTPIDSRKFLGGAGIVAAHASALGAFSSLVTVMGGDENGTFATELLSQYGVTTESVIDDSRPTTLKQRYRSEGKTLLKVSHLHQRSISPALQDAIFNRFMTAIESADLIVFSDFNYGCLPNRLIDRLIEGAQALQIPCIADSQSSSQVGDVSKFKYMTLISATEREVRIGLRNNDDGLTYLAERLRAITKSSHILMKLGAEGVLVHTSSADGLSLTNQLPALNCHPVDVAGAGDSMLITAGLALAAGATIWEAATVGSIASALQVGRLGNQPISMKELSSAIDVTLPIDERNY